MSSGFRLTLTRQARYRFGVEFDDGTTLTVDEAAPLGAGDGPNPSRLLATAVGHCLSASLSFCLERAKVDLADLRTTVDVRMERNDRGRLRIGGIAVTLDPRVAPDDLPRIQRCLEVFEDYCVVTESVRGGIPVEVSVHPATAPETVAGT